MIMMMMKKKHSKLIQIINHQIALTAWISLVIFFHPSLSSLLARPHRADINSCRSANLGRLYVGVHQRKLLMNTSLLHRQWSACLVHLIWIVCVMRGKWPYSCFFRVVTSKICSKQHLAFLCSFHQDSFLCFAIITYRDYQVC